MDVVTMWDARSKHWCEPCGFVCKARDGSKPLCPCCGTPMTNMGRIWKPGPKGDRMRYYPEGFRASRVVHGSQYPLGYTFVTTTYGGHGYHPQEYDREHGRYERMLRAPGRKLRQGGRIRSWRLP